MFSWIYWCHWSNKKNYVFNEAASKDYMCINQGTKPGLLLTISDHYRPLLATPNHLMSPWTIFNHFWQFGTIFDYFRPFLTVSDHFWLFPTTPTLPHTTPDHVQLLSSITTQFWPFLTIFDHFRPFSTTSDHDPKSIWWNGSDAFWIFSPTYSIHEIFHKCARTWQAASEPEVVYEAASLC